MGGDLSPAQSRPQSHGGFGQPSELRYSENGLDSSVSVEETVWRESATGSNLSEGFEAACSCARTRLKSA